jgi:hypothetical protein
MGDVAALGARDPRGRDMALLALAPDDVAGAQGRGAGGDDLVADTRAALHAKRAHRRGRVHRRRACSVMAAMLTWRALRFPPDKIPASLSRVP